LVGAAGDAVEVMMSEEGLAGAWFSGRWRCIFFVC
jgi:hypothetical protein